MGWRNGLKTANFLKHMLFGLVLGCCCLAANPSRAERLIDDGGFEKGPDASVWTEVVESPDEAFNETSIVMPDEISGWNIAAYQCKYAFWAGGSYSISDDETAPLSNYVEQEIDIPEQTLGLGFSTCFRREDEDDASPDDFLYVEIIGEDNTEANIFSREMTQANNTFPHWKRHFLMGISDFRGETVKLRIGAESGAGTPYTGNVLVDAIDLYQGRHQSVSEVNNDVYPAQAYTDDDTAELDTFLADDFDVGEEDGGDVEIYGMEIRGSALSDDPDVKKEITLHFEIYAEHFEIYDDDIGRPDGHPKDPNNKPVWSLSLAADDPQIDISAEGDDGKITVSPKIPVRLAKGRYWLVFYPQMSRADFGQFGWHVSDTTNGHEAMAITPDGDNGEQLWTPITAVSDWNVAQQDLAFTLFFQKAGEPEIKVSTSRLSETVAKDKTATAEFIIANIGDAFLEITSIKGPAAWIRLNPEKGDIEKSCGEMAVTVTFDASAKDVGTYRDIIEITSTDPDQNPVKITVEMMVTEDDGNNLSMGTLQFNASTITSEENSGAITALVTRTGGSDGAVGVTFETVDATAVSGADYQSTSGELTWTDGESGDREITISIKNDRNSENDEYFRLTLSDPTGGATLGRQDTAVLTITDDDKSNNDNANNNGSGLNYDFDTNTTGCFIESLAIQ